ncbi:uncharacterized protein LOC119449926 [Dermacentor silvarum]|uniref:uncharacterized protein LOC119449926 n=1 Tax=Dermacentor silvarum TaxID=543639 RepID=UPI00189B0B7C|nr:uncharacterized protein LOC119449926 [Dermacentor silvarum]XP_037569146.1 uncharacterized protein LOC119449926 [Dermacentor silvarum]XP_049521478.1 uncharacterized protein LOC119449926 [Dermacentor silvarum]
MQGTIKVFLSLKACKNVCTGSKLPPNILLCRGLLTSRSHGQMEAVATQVLEPSAAALKKQPAPVEPPEWPYTEHIVKVHTCAKLYQDWRKWKPGYQNAPPEGVEVELGYMHTGLDRPAAQREGCPTVLLLHGAPGSYRDFTQLVPFLDSHGVTVISPRWPDLRLSYRTGTFWHSAEEKTQLLTDFLKAINISKVDMLVAHSSAIYPTLNVMTRPGMPHVKSVALLAPAGHQLVRAIRPLPLMRAFAVHYTNPRYQGFMRHLGIAIMKYTRSPIKPNIEDAIMSLQTMIFSDYEEAGDKIKQVADSGIPLLIAFSENDRAINPQVIFNMVDLIGTRNQDLWLYDADGKLVRKGSTSGQRKVMLFKKGGHYLFRRHPEVVNSAIMDLLQTALASSK